jgi:hypothetical protein
MVLITNGGGGKFNATISLLNNGQNAEYPAVSVGAIQTSLHQTVV